MKIYDKLIRDRIPEIIRGSGRQYEVAPMDEAAYQTALREKLVEEAMEARDAAPERLLAELADLQEVMDAIMDLHGFMREDLEAEQRARRVERGGFSQRLRLLSTD